MSAEVTVQNNMDIIQNIFLYVQDIFFQSPDWKSHLAELESTDIEFRSIAYESASMSIALSDFKHGEKLTTWLQFLNEVATAHATQVHIGLGWALAQTLKNPIPYLLELHPMARYRVFDGYGYYEGIFRRRRSIIHHLKLNVDDSVASNALDQGLGRSIWYLNKGNIDAAKAMIESFDEHRRKDLWRGLGIAVTYVGGCSEYTLKEIFSKAGPYQTQLATGAVMSVISRHLAGFVTNSAELTAQLWCHITTPQIISEYQNQLSTTDNKAYTQWLNRIETTFQIAH